MRNIASALSLALILSFFSPTAFPEEEEMQYKKFNLENVSCDAGILYKDTPYGMRVGVSAVATGRGAEFRKWSVSDIRLRIGRKAVRPDAAGKFFVTKESLFRVPAAVVFAAIGTQIDVDGTALEKGIGKAGAAIGLGLLVMQAKGDIDGMQCSFNLDKDTAASIESGRDAIEITMENPELRLKETVKIGIVRPSAGAEKRFDYSGMGQDELIAFVDRLEGEVAGLEKDQGSYKYGRDPEYDGLQRRIEELQAERGIAYKTWLERQNR